MLRQHSVHKSKTGRDIQSPQTLNWRQKTTSALLRFAMTSVWFRERPDHSADSGCRHTDESVSRQRFIQGSIQFWRWSFMALNREVQGLTHSPRINRWKCHFVNFVVRTCSTFDRSGERKKPGAAVVSDVWEWECSCLCWSACVRVHKGGGCRQTGSRGLENRTGHHNSLSWSLATGRQTGWVKQQADRNLPPATSQRAFICEGNPAHFTHSNKHTQTHKLHFQVTALVSAGQNFLFRDVSDVRGKRKGGGTTDWFDCITTTD